MSRTIVFDVNETLLDLRPLDDPFREVFGTATARTTWFQTLLHQAFLTTITGPYVDFTTLGRHAIEVAADEHDVAVSDQEATRILETMHALPPHEDVEPALNRLRTAGLQLVALSNGTPAVLHDQLENAGLTSAFDHVFSADAAGRLKPAPEPYEMVAHALDVGTRDLRMVAAHAWDTSGARRAGCAAAFVARPGKRLAPSDPVPEIEGETLLEVVRQIVAVETG